MDEFEELEARYRCLAPWMQIKALLAKVSFLQERLSKALAAQGVSQPVLVSQIQFHINDLMGRAVLAYTEGNAARLTELAAAIEKSVDELWGVVKGVIDPAFKPLVKM